MDRDQDEPEPIELDHSRARLLRLSWDEALLKSLVGVLFLITLIRESKLVFKPILVWSLIKFVLVLGEEGLLLAAVWLVCV